VTGGLGILLLERCVGDALAFGESVEMLASSCLWVWPNDLTKTEQTSIY
jgi:hypothetical protein